MDITIIVKDGRVEAVYTDNEYAESITVNVIDCDTTDPEDQEYAAEAVKAVEEDLTQIY